MNTGATAPVKRENAAGAPRQGLLALFAEIGPALLATTLAGAATPSLASGDEAPAGAARRRNRGVN